MQTRIEASQSHGQAMGCLVFCVERKVDGIRKSMSPMSFRLAGCMRPVASRQEDAGFCLALARKLR